MRPNPPRMVTVVLSAALVALGLGLLYLPAAQVQGLVRDLPLPSGLDRDLVRLAADRVVAHVALIAGPSLLVVGSLLPRI